MAASPDCYITLSARSGQSNNDYHAPPSKVGAYHKSKCSIVYHPKDYLLCSWSKQRNGVWLLDRRSLYKAQRRSNMDNMRLDQLPQRDHTCHRKIR